MRSNATSTAAAEREARAAMEVLALKLLALEGKRRKAFHLAEKGQKVYLAVDFAKKYNISEGPYTVEKTEGEGDDQFADLVELRGVGGGPWPLRAKDFLAAPAARGRSPLDGTPTIAIKENQMQMTDTANKELLQLAERLRREEGLAWDDAARKAGALRPDLVEAGRPTEPGATVLKTAIPASFNLSADLEARAENGATFFELCQQYAAEKHCEFRQAVHVLGQRFPELADAR